MAGNQGKVGTRPSKGSVFKTGSANPSVRRAQQAPIKPVRTIKHSKRTK